MKGDLSRTSFRDRHFTRVVAQQGRIDLDADWNEQQAIIDGRLRTIAADTFGHGGLLARAVAPKLFAGFGLHVHRGAVLDAKVRPRITLSGRPLGAAADGTRAAFSVAAWLKPSAVAKGVAEPSRCIVRQGDSHADDFSISLDGRGRVIFARLLADEQTKTIASPTSISPNRFGHVVCIDTLDALEIWIDGVLDLRVAAPTTGAHERASGDIVIGPRAGESSPGELERIEVWRQRLLREDVVEAFMQRGPFISADSAWSFSQADVTMTAGAPTLCVGPGRCYVSGRQCEQYDHRPLGAQDGLPTSPVSGIHAYLDVWDQYVSAFEDAQITDPALGGLDTTGRLRTIARVGLSTLSPRDLRAAYAQNEDRGALALGLSAAPPQDNALYRFEVHAPGSAACADLDVARPAVSATYLRATASATYGTLTPGDPAVDWPSGTFLGIKDLPSTDGSTTTMRVVSRVAQTDANLASYLVADVPPACPATLSVRPIASVLWSRENAHGVFGIDPTSLDAGSGSTKMTLFDAGGRFRLIENSDVVVITSDDLVTNGAPGFVARIASKSTDVPGSIDIVVDAVIDALGPNPTLRVWDGLFPVDAGATKPVIAGDLTVAFGAVGAYRSGDYWSAIVRPDAPRAQRLDWPVGDDGPAFLAPEGVTHAYGLLGEIAVDADGTPRVVTDYRVILPAPGDALLDAIQAVDVGHDIPLDVPVEPPPPTPSPEPEEPRTTVVVSPIEIQRLPRGAVVLSAHALDGFESSGALVDAVVDLPRWTSDRAAPGSGDVDVVVIGTVLYALFRSGSFAALDVSHPANPWEPLRRFEGDRTDYTVAVAGERVYVVGGRDARGRPSPAINVYDPAYDTWTHLVIPMRAARSRPFAAAGTGRSLMIGGGERRTWFGFRYRSRSVERYDLEIERSARVRDMPIRESQTASSVIDGSLFIIGADSSTIRRMHLRSGEWSTFAVLDAIIESPALCAAGQYLIVADVASGKVQRLSLNAREPSPLPDVPARHCGFTALNGAMYAVAGHDDGAPTSRVMKMTLFERLRVQHPLAHHHGEGVSHGTHDR